MNIALRFSSVILFGTYFVSPALGQTTFPDFLIDLNQDGVIDSKDLLILIRKWGLEGIATPTPTSTETPTITDTLLPTETPTDPSSYTVDLPDRPTPLPLRMIRIPAGSFMMGSPDTERSRSASEGPLHEVTIAYDFYLSETEVTQAQFGAVMGGEPLEGDNYPVYLYWEDCQAFLAALNALGQGTYRLPSEAEWEYACRAGSTTRYYFGDSLGCGDECENCDAAKGVIVVDQRSDYMWYCGNSGDVTHPVRQRLPNFFGLYDMAGNAYEWCQDLSHADYTGAPTDGSAWESGEGHYRVVRGGGLSSAAALCRSAARGAGDTGEESAGFRIARTP